MEIKVISYSKGEEELHKITVGEETAVMRMRRSSKQAAQIHVEEEDPDVRILRLVIYPDCFASVVDWGTFKSPITFDEFANLPGQFVDDWAEAAWQLNPQWQMKINVQPDDSSKSEEDEKKVLN